MKIKRTHQGVLPIGQGIAKRLHRQQNGFAVLAVFILMVLMFGLVIQSGLVLRGLHQELRLLEKRQVAKYRMPLMATNAVPSRTPQRLIRITMDKTRIINGSLQCLRRAWISLIPVLGLFLAPVIWLRCWRIQRKVGTGWNPAARHVRLGQWLSMLAFIYQLIISVALVVVIPTLDDACNASSGR